MTEAPLLKAAPDAPSTVGDGIKVALAGGAMHELRFSIKAMVRVENTFGSAADYLAALETQPIGTLASTLIITDIAKDDASAIALLEGVNWRELREDLHRAWRRANWEPEPTAVPTTGP